MPTTELDVANEALHALQESPIADLDGEGKIPEALKFALPIARKTTLRMHDWTCARRRAPLTLITEESPGVPVANYSGRAFVYEEPAEALTTVDVLNPLTLQGASWIKEGRRIYTDEADAVGVYTVDLDDPTEWDDLLASSVAYMLAARVAYLVTGEQGRESMLIQLASSFIEAAKKQSYSEARQRRSPSDQWAPGLFDAEPRR